MADSRSLLSLIAQRDARGLEDAATDALRFIMSRSTSARQELSELLADERGPLPIAKVHTWAGVAHGAVPDLACRDDDDSLSENVLIPAMTGRSLDLNRDAGLGVGARNVP